MGSMLSSGSSPAQPDLSGKVLMVTGANRGIGFETAKQLYKLGGRVYLGARSETNALEAIARIRSEVKDGRGGELKWFPLDLGTISRARESAEGFLAMEDRLDVLVNNACLGDAAFDVNEDGIETMFATNHVGHFVLTTTLLPLMKKTTELAGADVRIVNVASTVHNLWGKNVRVSFTEPSDLSKPFPPKKPDTWSHILTRYSRTKLANILFTRELQRRLDEQGSDIISISLHPGYVATEAAKESTAKMPILGVISSLLVKLFFIDEAGGARNSVYAASNPVVRTESMRFKGQFLTPVGKITAPAPIAQDKQLANDLWVLTDKMMQQKINP
ncbi:short chain dehydrogenase [Ceratobasidium sp. AG-Ba]|nr:short chain dehydrogenase [Ceratobasidium sp. AG-Ba]